MSKTEDEISAHMKDIQNEKMEVYQMKEKTGKMQLLITYKGSANIEENVLHKMKENVVVLDLSTDGIPESMATATINFPEINGNSVLFIHDIISHSSDTKIILLNAIMYFAKQRGYE